MTRRAADALEDLLARLAETREEVEVTLRGDAEVHHGRLTVDLDGITLEASNGGRRALHVLAGGEARYGLPAWLYAEAAA